MFMPKWQAFVIAARYDVAFDFEGSFAVVRSDNNCSCSNVGYACFNLAGVKPIDSVAAKPVIGSWYMSFVCDFGQQFRDD